MPTAPAPRTWQNDQDYMTAATLNLEIRDALNFLLAPPRAILRRVAAQSIPNLTTPTTPVQWDTEDQDTAGGFTLASNTRYTAQYPGRYKISCVIGWTANATGLRVLAVNVNGGANVVMAIVNNVGTGLSTVVSGAITIPWQFSIGDYFQVQISQGSGAALTHAGGTDSYCTVEWIGK
jgi:hypothetical protein